MCREMRNPRKLKMRHYSDYIIGLNEYFYSLHGEKEIDNIGDTELNEIILNSTPNG